MTNPPNNAKKPRKWFCLVDRDKGRITVGFKTLDDLQTYVANNYSGSDYDFREQVHVIEHSAYLEAQAEVKTVRNEHAFTRGAVTALEQINTKIRAELTALKLENKKLTDWNGRKDLHTELATLRTENEKLRSSEDAEITRLREALEKIADKETLEGDKYNSYEESWEGVARFAREALQTKAKDEV